MWVVRSLGHSFNDVVDDFLDDTCVRADMARAGVFHTVKIALYEPLGEVRCLSAVVTDFWAVHW